MPNLNAEHEDGEYSDNHEPGNNWPESRNAQGTPNVHDASEPNSPIPRPDSSRTDHASMGEDGELAPHSDLGSGQPPIPGLAYAEQSLSYHSGPLPHPDLLAAYDQVRPGTADWIIGTADRAAETQAHSIRVTADSEAFALRVFAAGSIIAPIIVLIGGVILGAFGVESGVIIAAMGAIPLVIESVAKAVRSMRPSDGARDRGDQEGDGPA